MSGLAVPASREPQGALIADGEDRTDQIAVVYNHGEEPPKITISQVSMRVQTVLANGVAVVVVARATGPALTVDDILLVERFVPTDNGGCQGLDLPGRLQVPAELNGR